MLFIHNNRNFFATKVEDENLALPIKLEDLIKDRLYFGKQWRRFVQVLGADKRCLCLWEREKDRVYERVREHALVCKSVKTKERERERELFSCLVVYLPRVVSMGQRLADRLRWREC